MDNRKHSHYFKDIANYDELDIYLLLRLFGPLDHEIGHAIKKLLNAGKRGSKDKHQDIKEASDTLRRWLEIEEEMGGKQPPLLGVGEPMLSCEPIVPQVPEPVLLNDINIPLDLEKDESFSGNIICSRGLTDDGVMLYSLHRHDYQSHTDDRGNHYSLDGGCDYIRASSNLKVMPILKTSPIEVRSESLWGVRNCGDFPRYKERKRTIDDTDYVRIKDLTNEHICSIVKMFEESGNPSYKSGTGSVPSTIYEHYKSLPMR